MVDKITSIFLNSNSTILPIVYLSKVQKININKFVFKQTKKLVTELLTIHR